MCPKIALSTATCLAMPYFHTLYHKGTIFKKLLNIKCLFWFSLQTLPEKFIARRIEQDIINMYKSSCKVTVILVR